MKLFNHGEIPLQDAEEGTRNVKVRRLITSETGAENFYMRLFEVSAGGWTPLHTHPWEHEIFVLEGKGSAHSSSDERAFGNGDVIFIPSGEPHQIRNPGSEPLKFLCLIPSERLRKKSASH